tara:strand:- start:516 stop:740 length:225 start_codon:yes stop_codon:yes gene_type:complete
MKKKTNKTEKISEKGTESTLKSYKSDLNFAKAAKNNLEKEFDEGRKLVIYGLTISEMTDLALEMHRRGLKTIMK